MSWSRDFFEEIRKIDDSVATYISGLGFTSSEQMLIGAIILFGTVANSETAQSFRKLLKSDYRLSEFERLRIFLRLVDIPKSKFSDQAYEESVKELLRFMCSKPKVESSFRKRILAVRLIIRGLRTF